jgi:HK97 family phage prohead protease
MKQLPYIGELEVKSSSEDHVHIAGYASVFGEIDSYKDVVLRGAFAGVSSPRDVKFLWQHDMTKPIGVVTNLFEDEHGLYVEATINNETQQGREAVSLVKQGALNGLSIGYHSKEASYNSSGLREITDADLWEISLVTFPANAKAQINSIKTIGLDYMKAISLKIDRAQQALAQLYQP